MATSSSVNLETLTSSMTVVIAGEDEIVMVWDENRHLDNVTNGAQAFARVDGRWRAVDPTALAAANSSPEVKE